MYYCNSLLGSTLHLSGIDLLNGTPVIDIKPYIPLYDVPCVSKQGSTDSCNSNLEKLVLDSSISLEKEHEVDTESCNVAHYLKKLPDHLNVIFTNRAIEDLEHLTVKNRLVKDCPYDYLEAKKSIIEILRNDPRSVYRRQKCSDRLYYFCINNLHVTTWFDDDIAEVLRVKFKNEGVIK